MAYAGDFNYVGKAIVMVNGVFKDHEDNREDEAKRDRENMRALLQQKLKFDVVFADDLSADDMKAELTKGKLELLK